MSFWFFKVNPLKKNTPQTPPNRKYNTHIHIFIKSLFNNNLFILLSETFLFKKKQPWNKLWYTDMDWPQTNPTKVNLSAVFMRIHMDSHECNPQ